MGLERSSSCKPPAVDTVRECAGDSSGGEDTGGRGGGGGGRSRTGSWLQRFRSPRQIVYSSQGEESDGESQKTVQDRDDEKKDESPVTSPLLRESKDIKPAQKLERFDSKENSPSDPSTDSFPLETKTPPTSPPPTHSSMLPPQSLFKTPTRTPMHQTPKGRVQRAHTRATFGLPPAEGTSQAYGKYRRDHKR